MGSCCSKCIASRASDYSSYGKTLDEKVPDCESCKHDDVFFSSTLEELQTHCRDTLNLQSGDILLFHCTHAFGTYVQVVSGIPWDHVAIVVKLEEKDVPIVKALREKNPIPSEFSGTDVPDGKTVKMKWSEPKAGQLMVFEAMGFGVYATPLMECAILNGERWKYMSVRRLRDHKTNEPLNSEGHDILMNLMKETWARPYETSDFKGTMELLLPVIKGPPKIKKKNKTNEHLDNLFCSELVALALQRTKILPEDTLNSNEVMPHMFAPGLIIDEYIDHEHNDLRFGELELLLAPQTSVSKAIMSIREDIIAKA